MTKVIIDVEAEDGPKLMRKLRRLKSTIEVWGPYLYAMCRGYSQIHLATKLSVEELEHWLWEFSHCNYANVVEDKIQENAV